ncbi:hypothetical protein ABZ946_03770 [Streptomyces sp. NPDC046324]|uniref:hypothetical protein n=1 Tax=Streptomyces sp. NPDC046324 TaxID=3154915 RepID=UPI0033C4205F
MGDDLSCPGSGRSPGRGCGSPGRTEEGRWSELRAVGFSPSGRTPAVATSCDLTLWSRSEA